MIENPARQVILAIGHSARDTFEMLHAQGVPMEPKPFSMGVRIEHRQKDINAAQYGAAAERLPAAGRDAGRSFFSSKCAGCARTL